MGTDLLDISFRLEKNVGVTLTHQDWHDLLIENRDCTVGQLCDRLLEHQGLQDFLKHDITANAELWQTLQSSVAVATGRAVESIQLNLGFSEIYPRGSSKAEWQKLGAVGTLQMPTLRHPAWFTIATGIAAAMLLVLWPLMLIGDYRYWTLVAVCIGMLLVLTRFSDQCRYVVPSRIRTMKDFYKGVRAVNLNFFDRVSVRRTNEIETWEGLKNTLVDALGVDDDEIVRDAWLVKDLGCE